MKRTILSVVTAGLALTGGLVAGTAIAIAAGEGPPPPPPWVNSDGTVDESKIPDFAPALDGDGEVIKGNDGRPVMVKVEKGPPTLTPEQARQQDRGDEVSRQILSDREVITVRPNPVAPGQDK